LHLVCLPASELPEVGEKQFGQCPLVEVCEEEVIPLAKGEFPIGKVLALHKDISHLSMETARSFVREIHHDVGPE
jgi:hypothetical protein